MQVKFDLKLSVYSLKVSLFQNVLWCRHFLPKNERNNSSLLLVDLFSFVFWEKVKKSKRHFEII